MNPNYKIIGAILIAVALFGGGWTVGRDQVQNAWDAQKLADTERAMQVSSDYRAKEREWAEKLIEAQNEATKRETELVALRKSADDSLNGLRNTIKSLNSRLSQATAKASAETAATALELFGRCTEEYLGMAEKARRHSDDVRALGEGWPQ